MGDEASYPRPDELADFRSAGRVGIFDYLWTAAKQTFVGDIALIYFLAPHKAAHFITRAASNAFFTRDIAVNAVGNVADEQSWAYFTPLIEIEPIPFQTLRDASDGHLILKGRSGKFLRPEMIQALPIQAKDPADQLELDRVLATPVGLAELPRPGEITIDIWKAIAAGALSLEAHVSTYIVEPLLRHVLDGTRFSWKREHSIRGGSIDFVVFDDDAPSTAIEVKLATIEPPNGDWSTRRTFANCAVTPMSWESRECSSTLTACCSSSAAKTSRTATSRASTSPTMTSERSMITCGRAIDRHERR